MKLNIRTQALFGSPNGDGHDVDEAREATIVLKLPSTRFDVHNEDDLNKANLDSVKHMLLQIEQIEGSRSNLTI